MASATKARKGKEKPPPGKDISKNKTRIRRIGRVCHRCNVDNKSSCRYTDPHDPLSQCTECKKYNKMCIYPTRGYKGRDWKTKTADLVVLINQVLGYLERITGRRSATFGAIPQLRYERFVFLEGLDYEVERLTGFHWSKVDYAAQPANLIPYVLAAQPGLVPGAASAPAPVLPDPESQYYAMNTIIRAPVRTQEKPDGTAAPAPILPGPDSQEYAMKSIVPAPFTTQEKPDVTAPSGDKMDEA